MSVIVTRAGKGATLSWVEADANFINLNNDKLEAGTPATNIAVTPTGGIVATDVQTALSELDTEVTNRVVQTGNTGAAIIPTGTTGNRPGTPVEGHFRRNSELGQWEGYDGSQWSGIGGVSLDAAQTLSNKTLVTTEVSGALDFTDAVASLSVQSVSSITFDADGILAGSYKAGSIIDTDLTLGANSVPVKAALNATGSAPIYACRAWVNFNGTGTVAIRASGNVSSITDNGVGDYTINFTTAMPDANYAFSGFCNHPASTSPAGVLSFGNDFSMLPGSLRVKAANSTSGQAQDTQYITVGVYR